MNHEYQILCIFSLSLTQGINQPWLKKAPLCNLRWIPFKQ